MEVMSAEDYIRSLHGAKLDILQILPLQAGFEKFLSKDEK